MKTTCDDAIRVYAYHLWERAGRPEGRADDFWIAAQREVGADNAENATVDEALEETFPASDPAASTYRTTSG